MKLRPAISRRGGTQAVVVLSLGLLAVCGGLLLWLGDAFSNKVARGETVVVYCASGVMPAVEPAARQYEQEYGVTIRLQPGSSGILEQQIKQSNKGDLYIPADEQYLDRARREQRLAEVLPVAHLRLVLAVRPQNEKHIESLDDLLRPDVGLAIADKNAAVGAVTEKVLASWPLWPKLRAKATSKTTVTDVANDVKLGVRIDAALIWDATARQDGLKIIDVPELKDNPAGVSLIAAGVLKTSRVPTEALRFARYLAAPEKGEKFFAAEHYDTVPGDPWAVTPHLILFCGGVNRVAIKDTLAEFEKREGCRITATFLGCGTLVAMMKGGQRPDAYFACDVSFMRQVKDRFRRPTTISETDMVILVHKGNPKHIHTLADLGRSNVRVGIANEKLSALGALTLNLLREAGVYDKVIANRRATTPTADLLVTQLTTVDTLDAVVVYRANCNYVGDKGELISIDNPAAVARQPFAIQRDSQYPQLTARLLAAIESARSRERFESTGFRWRLESPQQ